MKKITGKHLAIATWIIAVIELMIYFPRIISILGNPYYVDILYIISSILIIVLQCILGFSMYRERNDGVTVFVVLLYCFVDILFPIIMNSFIGFSLMMIVSLVLALVPDCVLIIGLFARRKSNNVSVFSKIWFVPAVIHLACTLLSNILINGYLFNGMTSIAVSVVNFLILGYWLWSYLNYLTVKTDNDFAQATKNGQIAYFDDLLKRGVISQQEYDEKISQLSVN